MIDQVKVQRLAEFVEFPFVWDEVVLSLEEIKSSLPNVTVEDEQFPDSLTHPKRVNSEYDKEWHIGRVKYFCENPELITPISIDNDCSSGFISGYPIIVDGHHRFVAALISNLDTVPAYYSGLVDTLEYLTGESDSIMGVEEFDSDEV